MNLKKLFNIAPYTEKVEDGFSGHQDIWGLMEDEIDYSAVINPQDEGDVYAVRLYGGDGHLTDLYCVNATDNQDAIDKVFDWVYENDNDGKELIGDWRGLSDFVSENYTDDGGDLSDTEKYKEYFDEFVKENFISNSDESLYAYAENFFVGKVPQEYLNKEVSDSADKVSDSEDEFENWEDYRFTFTIYGNDGEIIDQFDGTDVYTELSDTLYDDGSAIELAKEALQNYAKSYDGEGDKIVISVDADEYDMDRDDYSGKVREVYSEEYDLSDSTDKVSDSEDEFDIDDERTSLWSRTYNKIVNFAINNDMINVPIEVNTEDIKSIKVDDEGYITVITQYGDEDFIENYKDDVMFDIYNKVTNA